MSALANIPRKLAAPEQGLERPRRERRVLRLVAPVPRGDQVPPRVLDAWSRALDATGRALDAAEGMRIYDTNELASRRRRLSEERRWFERLQQVGTYDRLPRLHAHP